MRGSRHAWDIRLISADALIKLVQIKENADGPETGLKIRSLLAPMEYTRLDPMIDVMFTAAKDVEAAASATEAEGEPESEIQASAQTAVDAGKKKGSWQFTQPELLNAKREQIISAVGKRSGVALISKSRALFWDAGHIVRLACTVSKRYPGSHRYWYAYHPRWHEFLKEGNKSYLALGCMDLEVAFLLPIEALDPILSGLNTTTKDDGDIYWHLHVVEHATKHYELLMPKKPPGLDLAEYTINI